MRWRRLGLACALAVAGCGDNRPFGHENPYWTWSDQRQVGAIEIDNLSGSDDAATLDDFALAQHDDDVMMLYAHIPGQTVALDEVQTMLQRAQDDGFEYVTFADLAAAAPGVAGKRALCLSFDDTAVDQWFTLRPLLAEYHARVSFFVTEYPSFTATGRDELHQLFTDGNSVEAHGLHHLDAVDYVGSNGMDAYLANEVQPSIDLLRADGFTPVAFAYPHGAHSADIDAALEPVIQITRGISTVPGVPRGGSSDATPP